jgi:hypothetical protein
MSTYVIAGVIVHMSSRTAAAWNAGKYHHGMVVEAMPGFWPAGTYASLPAEIRSRMDGFPAYRC